MKRVLISLDELYCAMVTGYETPRKDAFEDRRWLREQAKKWFDAQPDVNDMLVEDFLKISKYHRED